MFEQYLRIKEDYPDCLLFYRMGDFYELFFEDAEIAARELQIALTARNKQSDSPVPMCGVPHHSYESYAAKLIESGYKIAICNQVEDPKQAKGLVKREVTRILTPGTVVEDENLASSASNYLAALYYDADKGAGGLAWADISTGEWTGLYSAKQEQLWQWMAKISPRELLLPTDVEPPKEFLSGNLRVNHMPERSHFDLKAAERRLLEAQKVPDLQALDLADKPQLVQACGAILVYLIQTQKSDSVPLTPFAPMNLSRHLLLDEVTERNLEIFRRLDGGRGRGTLWGVLDRTMTPMGARLLAERLRRPWKDPTPIERNLDAVQFFHENEDLREDLRHELDAVYDIERLSTRIFLNRATPKDFTALRESLNALPDVHRLLVSAEEDGLLPPRSVTTLLKGWDGLEDYGSLLERALVDNPPHLITEGGLFKRGYHPELDELIALTDDGESRVGDLLQKEKDASGLEKLKLGFNKVFGYYFEVSKLHSEKVPDYFMRKQTLVNSERYITPELKELEDNLLSASDRRKDLEYKMFLELRDNVASARHRFMDMAQRLAALDVWQGLGEAAQRNDWQRPEIHTGLDMQITQGRHPVVEAVQGQADYIPNNLHISDSKRVNIITGPNMAGKSTVLRQAAIISIMAQIGSYVPASSAKLGLTDRIFSRVGASDNLAAGQSTFMVEMMETARILRQAGKRSLVILDEIGRGTSTFDGLALAWSVAEELAKRGDGGIRTLFATHYHELTVLENELEGVANFNIAVKEYKGDIIFLRKLVPGPSDRSYGIEVAKLAGVPRPVVVRAKEILTDLESRAGGTRSLTALRPAAQQPTLPGLGVPSPEPDTPKVPKEVLALAEEFQGLEVDRLTPIEALNFLHTWKAALPNKD